MMDIVAMDLSIWKHLSDSGRTNSTSPEVSGKPHAILKHERLISYINQHEGVEWCKIEDMAAEFKSGVSGRFPGHVVGM